jgi:uncharacterized protein (TIGR00725 family)
MIRLVSVIGGGIASPAEESQAEEVGRLLAQRGYGVVCGGRWGVMAAACRGAKSAGGITVGILPGPSPKEANPWVDVVIPTGMGEARNALVVASGEAVIAIGGEHGTLSEIALALKMGKRVVGLRTWQLCRDGNPVAGVIEAKSPSEAVRLALKEV